MEEPPQDQPPEQPIQPEQPAQPPQQALPPQPPPYGQQPPPGQYYGQPVMYPEASQATTALVLGLLGIIFCALCAPFAWSIGNKEIEAIDAGRRDPSKRDLANAGKILGIIGCVLLVLSIVFVIVMVLFFGFLGVASSA